MAAAIDAIKSGKSMRSATTTYRIPQTTLQSRLTTQQPHNITHKRYYNKNPPEPKRS
ncbi:hypothetical protein ABW20_dc0107223 [Dactylellina cionopaga]|nr:hypothetical protein ABW20_dc0107223 [Dactylellina cionopaga]